jgi:hypothetical protein
MWYISFLYNNCTCNVLIKSIFSYYVFVYRKITDALLLLTVFLNSLQKGIDENWQAALEHYPEAFARVVCIIFNLHNPPPPPPPPPTSPAFYFGINFKVSYATLQVMLYVDMEVNGVPLKVT